MATTPVYTRTAYDIVKQALLVLGVTDRERPLTADLRQAGFSMLSYLVKSLQVNYHLWTDTEAVLLLEQGVSEYTLGPNGSNVADKSDLRNYTVDSSSSGTSLNVTGNISTGDNIGIILNDGSIFWTAVSSYAAGVATLIGSLPSTVNAGNLVYVYTNKIPRPIKVVNARYKSNIASSDTPTTKYNRTQYFETLDKSLTGTVQAWYYSPQLTDGVLYVYKVPSNNFQCLSITYTRPLEITDVNGDLVDFPAEWYLPLTYFLAYALLPQFPTPGQMAQDIKDKASFYGEMVGMPPLGKMQPLPEAGRA